MATGGLADDDEEMDLRSGAGRSGAALLLGPLIGRGRARRGATRPAGVVVHHTTLERRLGAEALVIVVVVHLLDLGLEDAHRAPETTRCVGQLLATEEHEDNEQDDQQVRTVEEIPEHAAVLRCAD
jgi:hypothetical protein